MAPKKQLPDEISILVIGCGGTGSAFLQNLMPYLVHRSDSPKVTVTLCDGDTVEEKNLTRQVFFEDQIGMNKATALAESIEATFGYSVSVCDRYLEDVDEIEKQFVGKRSYFSRFLLPVLVGCVDNLKARAVYEAWFSSRETAIYIDCANEEFHGEVVYATRLNGTLVSPVRSVVFPSFARQLQLEAETLRFRSEQDCLQRSISSPQHIFTNKMSGLLAACAVSSLLDTQRPPMGVDYFSTRPTASVVHQDTSALCGAVSNRKTKPARKKKAG